MQSYKIYAKHEGKLAAWLVNAQSREQAIELVRHELKTRAPVLCLIEGGRL